MIPSISNISKDLKNLQVLKQIPIITVSQQNRTKNDDGSMDTTMIAQSDRIGQDSTVIIFFEQEKEHHILNMHLVKSRDSVNMKKLQYVFDFDLGIFLCINDGEDEDAAEDRMNSERAKVLRQRFDGITSFESAPF